MAEIEKKHYNLRSGNDTVKLPVHMQLSNDSEFVNRAIENYQDSDLGESWIWI